MKIAQGMLYIIQTVLKLVGGRLKLLLFFFFWYPCINYFYWNKINNFQQTEKNTYNSYIYIYSKYFVLNLMCIIQLKIIIIKFFLLSYVIIK